MIGEYVRRPCNYFQAFLIAATMLQLGTSSTDSTSGLLKTKTTFQGFSTIGFYTCSGGFSCDPGMTGLSREFSSHFSCTTIGISILLIDSRSHFLAILP
jgi:hypothetical protein